MFSHCRWWMEWNGWYAYKRPMWLGGVSPHSDNAKRHCHRLHHSPRPGRGAPSSPISKKKFHNLQEIATLIAPKNQGMALDLWVYFNLFPPPLWLAFLAALALLSFCWYLIALSGISKLHGDYDSEPFSCANGLGVVGLLWFQLDYPTLKKKKWRNNLSPECSCLV